MWLFGQKRAERPVEALPRLRRALLARVKPGLRPPRRPSQPWIVAAERAARSAPPNPLSLIAKPQPSAFPRAVAVARRGPVRRKVPVELAAASRGRVRKWPALLINLVLLILAADLAGSIYLREAMGVKLLDEYTANLIPPSESVVTDSEGNRLGIFAAADAVRVPLDDIPTVFRDALVRWEDTRFYAHDGVDRYRMLGAVNALLHGAPQGGSTLTMQLAKLIKKDSARTLRRKLEDISLALAMDNRLGKADVLKDYANQAYFGSGVYGLGQACRYYFARDKCVGLTIEEAAYLVSLLRAPADLAREPEKALARRNLVIDQMREPDPRMRGNAFVRFSRKLFVAAYNTVEHRVGGRSTLIATYSNEDLDNAKRLPLNLARAREPHTHPFVLETAREEMQKKLGTQIYDDGLHIRLTINSEIQQAAEAALKFGLDNYRELRRKVGHEADADLDGGAVVIDPRTGHLLAYVPGADFSTSQVAFAARPIQIGSGMKPFVYGELFEQGKGDIDTLVDDLPLCIGGWCPHDYEAKYEGRVPVWFALSRSLNTSAVRVADKVGVDSITARLRLLGVQSPITANLPMALGASELTLLEMGGMYSALWDGHAEKPTLVLDVRDRDGKVIYGGDDPDRPRVYKPSTVDMLHVAMQGVMAPGGTAAVVGRELEEYYGVPASRHLGEVPGLTPQFACKTGTHDSFTRVGLNCVLSDSDYGPVVIVAYIGDRTPKPLGEGLTGGRVAGPVIEKIAEAITARTRAVGFFRPFPQLDDKPVVSSDVRPPAPLPADTAQLVADTLHQRDLHDPGRVALSLAQASMAGPPDAVQTQATVAMAPLGTEGNTLTALSAAPRLAAPRDWPGLWVLDTDTVEAQGPDVVESFLQSGGREEELTELGPLFGMTSERHVIHKHRLLQMVGSFETKPTDHESEWSQDRDRIRVLTDKTVTLGENAFASLKRMMSTKTVSTQFERPDANTHVVSEEDADRRIERVYHFANPPQMFRVTRHHTSGTLLSLEWMDAEGKRHAMVRENDRMVPLETREVEVRSGALETAWLEGGMSPSQLDGLRALIGGSMSIDRIPRGFQLDLLVTETGGLLGVAATKPDANKGPPQHASAIRIDSACLGTDGIPCGRRFMPLPLAEARFYGQRAAGDDGAVLIQRDSPGTVVATPAAGRVVVADRERNQIRIATDDGRVLQFDGVIPGYQLGETLAFGAPLGRLDPRGVLVYRALQPLPDGRLSQLEVSDSLPELGGADESLRAVSGWWRDLQLWLEGDEPVLRHPPAAHHS